MKIYVSSQGRLGNNLFQYFFALILSRKLKAELYTLFTIPETFGLDYNLGTKPESNFCLLFEKCQGPHRELLLNGKIIEDDWENIVNEILKLKVENVVVTGFFQILSYYLDEKDFIKNSFSCKIQKEENTFGIHLRKDDITGTQNDLPDFWFESMSERFPHHTKFLTTDSPNCSLVQRLMSKGFQLWDSSPEDTILKFAGFSDIVLSQGTFSWWIAFLSEGRKHNLIPEIGWNSEKSRIKLFPPWENWVYYKIQGQSLIQTTLER